MLCIIVCIFLPTALSAQDRRPSHCIAVAEADPTIHYIHKAAFRAPLPDDFTVRLSYIDHAMFLLETPGGLTAVTDYVGFIGTTSLVPDVVTMNIAHDSHWTAFPDERIPHVLPGWSQEDAGTPANHYLDLGEMLVRSVSTDIRDRFGGPGRPNGNSIFVFEVGGLCIGHLGHLHHEPTANQYAALGRLDVVLAPVDGGLTVDLGTLFRILDRLKSSIVIPMHWFGRGTLNQFLSDMSEGGFLVETQDASHLEVSLRTLPRRPTVIVLRPRFLSDSE